MGVGVVGGVGVGVGSESEGEERRNTLTHTPTHPHPPTPIHPQDTFHEQNHTRHMCKNEMRANHPSHNQMFECTNSQIAEETFSIIMNYKNHWSNYSYPKSYINFIVFFSSVQL
jgi:hypothetical protein